MLLLGLYYLRLKFGGPVNRFVEMYLNIIRTRRPSSNVELIYVTV